MGLSSLFTYLGLRGPPKPVTRIRIDDTIHNFTFMTRLETASIRQPK